MRDIENTQDIQFLVENFYSQVLNDPQIGPLFRAANFDLDSHIPMMVSFWETILFDVITYQGNPMLKHIALNRIVPLQDTDFTQWMNLWKTTVLKHFEGPKAEKAIVRATSIAHLMQHKIKQTR